MLNDIGRRTPRTLQGGDGGTSESPVKEEEGGIEGDGEEDPGEVRGFCEEIVPFARYDEDGL